MTVGIIKAGLFTTVQAGPRRALRHLGVPSSGAADPLSLALANRLVGNAWDAPALEMTMVAATLQFNRRVAFGLAGAPAEAILNGETVDFHRSITAQEGDILSIGGIASGARAYIAFAGGLRAPQILGSASTYTTGGFGGFEGRALADGDELGIEPAEPSGDVQTPVKFRAPAMKSWTLRTCESCETGLLSDETRTALFAGKWMASRRADRMGIQLTGPELRVRSDGRMPSAPVFPGTIQCTEGGVPYLLCAESGTTGGYPRIAQVVRCDRHLLGQVRPGDSVHLLQRDVATANRELREKITYWQEWLPDIREIL
ncbi:MAG: biotin-dependent carboxyltransferase family protein [Woeseiaceae bacterium]